MTNEEAKAYVQGLVDAGVYDPEVPADPDFDEFITELELKEEVEDAGNWLIRVYKDYGTIFEKEFLRVYAPKEGNITAAPPHNPDAEIPVGPQSVIKLFVDKLRGDAMERLHRKGDPMRRSDATESPPAGDKF